jgi:hypothetical protein
MTMNEMRGKKIGLMASGFVLAGLATWNFWPASALPADAKADLVVVHKGNEDHSQTLVSPPVKYEV